MSSTSRNINDKDDQSYTEWTVLYHAPGQFKGRGEFLRLMLEDAGASYVNSAENLYGPEGMMDGFRGGDAATAISKHHDSVTFPLLFPPAIWHRPKDAPSVMVNQTAACMAYLGDVLGYAPSTPAERARANAVTLNALDYIAEGRSSFHPVKNSMSYKDQKDEGDKCSKEFVGTRMKIFLYHFAKIVAGNATSTSPIAGGSAVTYADFALFHVLDATVSQFNTEFYAHAWDAFEGKELKEYYQWMKDRPNLQKYFQSDRCAPFAGDSMM
ncbi:glutathione S-transferase [Nitzschia inconspicua]|uniref:Glutathione S-transferase n=1 Tax=Nitzschia inconspicua TaxID=303405 RepID=A0A9K3PHG8_9STRA|nr:glutathione S-transferase [Nitzschia inconspicua]